MCKILKSVTFFLSFLFFMNVIACPELSGVYRCTTRGEEQTYTTKINREVHEGISTYSMSNDSQAAILYIVDGLERTITTFEENDEMDLYYQASCSSDALFVDFKTVLYDGEQKVGSQDYRHTIKFDVENNLIQTIKGVSVVDGHEETFEMNFNCRPLLD